MAQDDKSAAPGKELDATQTDAVGGGLSCKPQAIMPRVVAFSLKGELADLVRVSELGTKRSPG